MANFSLKEILPLPEELISLINLYAVGSPTAKIIQPAIEKFNNLYEACDGICEECNNKVDERNNHWMVKYIYTLNPIVSSCKYSTILCKFCVSNELKIGIEEFNEYYSHITVRTRA